MIKLFTNWLKHLLNSKLHDSTFENAIVLFISILLFSVICWGIWKISRQIFLVYVERLAQKTSTYWDDALVQHKFFRKLAHILPAFLIQFAIPDLLYAYPQSIEYLLRLSDAFIVGVFMMVLVAFISAFEEVLSRKEFLKDKPISSYAQLSKIVVYIICGIIILSILLNKSPLYFFSAMGAMTAVVLLVFKDTILGFVASIQIAANDMLRVGDWVTMEKYGADGDVESINLTTVKVRNFDKTITTIPTYAFISDSFRNWRGMEESEGRRIKRALNIKIASVKFCSEEQIQKLLKIEKLRPYLNEKLKEIQNENALKNIKNPKLNGRHLTNIGVFRAYVLAYLKQNENINPEMTMMVRQLNPTPTGVPLEVYAFSKHKNWVLFENILSDVFDHLMAIIPEFELEVFENPTGDWSVSKSNS